jgi:hypothetical protein
MKPSSEDKLRAWWSHRQGLDGRLAGKPPADVLEQAGWARSLGGVGPYLALLARAGTSREGVDAAVAKVDIHELPAARGCTYVVPASDFEVALKAGADSGNAEMKTAGKLGVTEKEIRKLCEAVMKALEKGPLEPDQIREATGKASRSLGEEGKKKGMTTTLPLALAELQASGDIRRVPMNGRLDQQRYRYTLWRPNPVVNSKLSAEEVNMALARRFFEWSGGGSLVEFQTFSGLSGKAAKAAVQPLRLETFDEERWMLPGDREKFDAFRTPKEAQYVLVSGIDTVCLLRRDMKCLLAGETDLTRAFLQGEGGGRSASHVPSHRIFDRGRLVGLWEYDPVAESIAWCSFIPTNRDLKNAVARTEEYVRAELGDARSYSLDSPKSRAPRIAALRKAAAG